MQISHATALCMGLRVAIATRYRVTREKVPVKSKSGETRYQTVTHKTPYTVVV